MDKIKKQRSCFTSNHMRIMENDSGRQMIGLAEFHRDLIPEPEGLQMTLSLGDVAVRKLEVEIHFDEGSLEPIGARVHSLVLSKDQARGLLQLLSERN